MFPRFFRLVGTGGVVVITTAKLHSTKPELRFCADSNPACGVLAICDGEDFWQCSRLEIRLNTFRQSTIPQKQFIIITLDQCCIIVGKLLKNSFDRVPNKPLYIHLDSLHMSPSLLNLINFWIQWFDKVNQRHFS